MASAQIAPARAASAPPSASLLDSADPAVAAVQPTVPRLPQLDDAKSNEAAQTPVARTESDKFVELLEAEVAQPADPESRIPRKNDPEVCADAPAAPPLSNQVTASPVVQSGFTQSQASDQTVQPVASNPRVMPRTSLSKPAFDQAAGVKSGHNPPLGKIQPPVVSPSSADRHSGKESASRMAGPAEQKPDAPSSDAVKAIDQSEAADTPPAKAQPGPDAAGALPPHALRADVMAGTDASDSSPKPDASSQAPADSRVATHAALPAERPAEPLRSAQLVEKITQSELRLEMRTGEFGNVEIRTSYDHQQVKAEISSQRGELGRTLSAELPGLEQRMRDQDVPLSAVVVHDASSGAGGTLDRDPRQQQQPLPAPPSAMGTSSANSTATVLQPEAWEPEGILDVRI